jgi:hypothetical protein
MKPWKPSPYCLRNGVAGHEYRGINLLIISLGLFDDPRYCTFFSGSGEGMENQKGKQEFAREVCGKNHQGEGRIAKQRRKGG